MNLVFTSINFRVFTLRTFVSRSNLPVRDEMFVYESELSQYLGIRTDTFLYDSDCSYFYQDLDNRHIGQCWL